MPDAVRILDTEPLTAEAFARFGNVIGTRGGHDERTINYGYTTAWYDLADIDVARDDGRPLVRLFETRPMARPVRIRTMERHPLGSQLFMPLSVSRWLMVVAERGNFDAKTLRAFLIGPDQGVNLRPGVWHHFSLALDTPARFLVLDREGPGVHTEEHDLTEAEQVLIDVD